MSYNNYRSLKDFLGSPQPTARNTLLGGPLSSQSRWSSRFETWAKPLSDTEVQKCKNARSVIITALNDHSELDGLEISVHAQGSYAANTNVRADSDVDLRVQCSNTFHFKLPPGVEPYQANISTPAALDFATYRSKIGKVLYDRFTIYGVTPGDKAFNVDENTYRINADVVPTFEYREYYWVGSSLYYRTGSCFFSKSGKFIVNWPDQTLENGKKKNEHTGKRYKKVVRVLKSLRNEMEEKKYDSATKISSHQIACLAYNVMDGFYNNGGDLYDALNAVSGQIWYHAHDSSKAAGWTEIDGIKPLFPPETTGKFQEVAKFFWDLRQYAELMD